jgi:hypothetical protein
MCVEDKGEIRRYVKSGHVDVFRAAARFYRVYIALRRTNPASIFYIGEPGYVPKRLDCKAKTADFDVAVEGRTRQLAGLVVDPTRVGPGAFKTGKFEAALTEWQKFKPLLAPDMIDAAGKRAYTYMPGGKFYAVQLDKAHPHYGCVMFASDSLLTGAKFIHGDYDLYAIVPAGDPGTNVFVEETRLGVPHLRGKDFFDVQHFVNGRIGAPMILHGDQEKYRDHTDEPIDVFYPDGRVMTCRNKIEIQALYRNEFAGRQPFSPARGTPSQPAGGLWRKA